MKDVNNLTARIFKAIDQRNVIDGAEVIRLSPRRRIECGSVENQARAIAETLCPDDGRVKLQKIRIVVIQAFRFHFNSPLPAAQEHDARTAGVQPRYCRRDKSE